MRCRIGSISRHGFSTCWARRPRHEQSVIGQIVVGSPVLEVGLDYCVDVLTSTWPHRRADAARRPVCTNRRATRYMQPGSGEGPSRRQCCTCSRRSGRTIPPAQWYRSRFRRRSHLPRHRAPVAVAAHPSNGRDRCHSRRDLLIESVYGPDAEAHIPKALLPSREKQEGATSTPNTLARGATASNSTRLPPGRPANGIKSDTPTHLAPRKVVRSSCCSREGHTLRALGGGPPAPSGRKHSEGTVASFARNHTRHGRLLTRQHSTICAPATALKYATLLVMVPSQAPGVWRAEGIDNRQRPVVALYDPWMAHTGPRLTTSIEYGEPAQSIAKWVISAYTCGEPSNCSSHTI